MKRITVVALLALTYFAGNLRASAQENAVQATIPFDFTVGHQLLPSGEYRVAAVAPNVVSISNAAKHVTVLSQAYLQPAIKTAIEIEIRHRIDDPVQSN